MHDRSADYYAKFQPKNQAERHSLSFFFLIEHFSVIQNLNTEIEQRKYMIETEEKVVDSKLDKKIEDLDLSVRSYNCLKRANINTVGELTQKTES